MSSKSVIILPAIFSCFGLLDWRFLKRPASRPEFLQLSPIGVALGRVGPPPSVPFRNQCIPTNVAVLQFGIPLLGVGQECRNCHHTPSAMYPTSEFFFVTGIAFLFACY